MAHKNAHRIELGRLLAHWRGRAGLSPAAVEAELGWHAGKLSRVENGGRKAAKTELETLVRLYGIPPGREAEQVLALGALARKNEAPARVADFAQTYVALLRQADEVSYYDTELVPALAQTEQTARAILKPHPDVEQRVADRMRRQSLLTRPEPLELRIVLGEAALFRELATSAENPSGVEILRGQLEHLIELGTLPNVRIQVLPFKAGFHRSLGVGFTMLRVPSSDDKSPIERVYIEGITDGTYIHDPAEIVEYDDIFGELQRLALDEAQSVNILRRRIQQLTEESDDYRGVRAVEEVNQNTG
ncbi:hypothetical protein BBK82_04920 [Lentzea guizhouensis]|uniref:HTH cro/C1-type domain-containing protein n=1 Tax=Lentzea guizhouensis TaxID=1586287 RepID=A0A1B2HCS4_9PSEU|nr:helix-turn-helix transcriptional regulator [Lentzea guizhouensis]ANZ35518.1 hypothetical protein BBK82_04920 [Lentzea guizhouensis]